ncbi:hypothetical protein T05_15943 [Trichinella murrelli]|uniref:Uncharacterized protein n=1 Tax=Trichinella murrelli TaxID=144512 RepID=A0A0V0T2I0_9BILA|nr:hypothetical protein T05_15943 [Trichinella murrelli]
MLHLTHRTLDVFRQLRHRFFWFIISGQCATWSNLAAVVGSGLLTRLLLVSVFAVTDMRPRDFLAYALFIFVKASAISNVKCIECFWLLLAASLVLRSLLYCSHPFTTATWSVQKKFSCSIFYFGGLSDTMLATSPPNLRRPSGADVEGTPTSPFQLFLRFQWRVLQSVSPNCSDGVDAFSLIILVAELHHNIKTEAATGFLYSWHFTFIKGEVVQKP